jgi:hypothetical protein
LPLAFAFAGAFCWMRSVLPLLLPYACYFSASFPTTTAVRLPLPLFALHSGFGCACTNVPCLLRTHLDIPCSDADGICGLRTFFSARLCGFSANGGRDGGLRWKAALRHLLFNHRGRLYRCLYVRSPVRVARRSPCCSATRRHVAASPSLLCDIAALAFPGQRLVLLPGRLTFHRGNIAARLYTPLRVRATRLP